MDYFTDLLAMFLDVDRVNYIAVYGEGQKALGIHHKYLNLCSEDERMSYGFGMTWGWVINDNFHFWVNYAFKFERIDCILEFCFPAGTDQVSCAAGLNSRTKRGSGL